MNAFRCLQLAILLVISFSTLSFAQRGGFVVTSDYHGVQSINGGYRSVTVTVATADGKPARRDIRLNLCLKHGRWLRGATVSTPLVIKAGRKSGSAKLIYEYSSGDQIVWIESNLNRRYDANDIFVDSIDRWSLGTWSDSYLFVSSTVKRKQLIPVNTTRGASRATTTPPSDVGENLPSFHRLVVALDGSSAGDRREVLRQYDSIDTATPDGLPDNWVELSSVQHIVMSRSDLQQLADNFPDSLEALKKWMAAGGRLIVNSCGEDCNEVSKITRALGIPAVPRSDWLRCRKKSLDKYETISLRARNQRMFFESRLVSITDESELKLDPQIKMAAIRFGQGQIVATDNDMSGWSVDSWRRLLTTMETVSADLHFQIGHGILSRGQVPDKKIPGVREPPPSVFQFLIICFVIVVGPLNYVLLRRVQRLNVLLITVPLISFVACFLLFGYAMFVEGIGTKVRHDSVTFLDQRNDVAVSRSLHSVFSGMQPGRYVFPDDQLVFLADDEFDDTNIIYENGTVSFFGGPIQARTPHQLTTTDSYSTNVGLRFNDQDGQLQVRNDFTNSIECLLVAYQDKLFKLENLEPGAVGTAHEIDETQVNQSFRAALNEVIPDERVKRNYESWGFNNHIIDGATTTPLLSPNTYMAVFKEFDGVRPLREGLSKKYGAHVVVGRW